MHKIHLHTGDSSGKVRCVLSFAWLPHTSAECQLSFLFCTWRRWRNDEGNKNTKQQKRSPTMPLSWRHLLPLSPSLHPPLPLSLSLCAPRPHSHSLIEYHLALPLNPPPCVRTLRCTMERFEERKWVGGHRSNNTGHYCLNVAAASFMSCMLHAFVLQWVVMKTLTALTPRFPLLTCSFIICFA